MTLRTAEVGRKEGRMGPGQGQSHQIFSLKVNDLLYSPMRQHIDLLSSMALLSFGLVRAVQCPYLKSKKSTLMISE